MKHNHYVILGCYATFWYSDIKHSVEIAASIFRVEEQSQKVPIHHVVRTSCHVTKYRRIDLHNPTSFKPHMHNNL
jgi:hypothetical protein